MSKRVAFCEYCRDDVEYTVEEKNLSGQLKAKSYTYPGKVARCTRCVKEVYVAEVMDANLKALHSVYRRENGIMPLEHILAIPKMYAIGKRPLSLLLGWGEHTFTRYCEGDIPRKQYEQTLEKIYSSPQYYLEILETNKENLSSYSAYYKSKEAVEKLLSVMNKDNSKIEEIAKYLLHQCEEISPIALQSALYYCQGFYYAFYGNYLFSDECEAWVEGPVYPEIYRKYPDLIQEYSYKVGEVDNQGLSLAEREILDSVIHHFCCYSAMVLKKFAYSESPWLTARSRYTSQLSSQKTIPKEDLRDYFVAIKQKYRMLNPRDIGAYARDMFDDTFIL